MRTGMLPLLVLIAALGVSLIFSDARAQFDDYDQPIRPKRSSASQGQSGGSGRTPSTPTPYPTSTPAAKGQATPTPTPKGPSPFERDMDIFKR